MLVPAVCLPFPLCLANQWQTSSVITAVQLHDTACQALDTHRKHPFLCWGVTFVTCASREYNMRLSKTFSRVLIRISDDGPKPRWHHHHLQGKCA